MTERACMFYKRKECTTLQTLLFVFSPVSECRVSSEIPMSDIIWVTKYTDIHLQTNTSNVFINKFGIVNLDYVVNLENITRISRYR